jgi:prepilin-type N-terminal cleavage/methylation domain-containing protein
MERLWLNDMMNKFSIFQRPFSIDFPLNYLSKWQMANGKWQILRGQSLVEVLAALGIIAIVVSAAAGIIVTSLNNVESAKNKTLSTKYAQEGLEAIRELRNKNYTQFRNYTGIYCLGSIPAVLNLRSSSCTAPNVANFIRLVQMEQDGCGINVAKVTVSASWSDGKCSASNRYCHISSHSTCLSIVGQVQAP